MNQYNGFELEGLSKAHNYYSWIIREYKPFIKGKVLEIGSGIGTFSTYLLELQIEKLVCLEPSSKLATALKHKLDGISNGIHVEAFHQTLEQFQINNSEKFDTIICVNVLEHINNDCQALVIMNNLLKKHGNLCLFVPAIPYLYGTLDVSFGHYRRYSKKQIRTLLMNSGFEIQKIKYFHAVGIITWMLMCKIFKWGTWNMKAVKIYDQVVTPIISNIEKIITPPIGQSLISIGKKTKDIPRIRYI
jgi:2-polyprenyl-3-methyl-5-hydroxy-6-metoxy-1,4-benzoquinol methylase